MIYLKLIWSFFQIGLFSFGGGYASIPLIENQVVTLNGWLSSTQFADIITISQMTPGPVAINCATFVGLRTAGLGGAIAATFGCVLPSCLIVLALAKLYQKFGELPLLKGILKGLRPAVVALIAAAGLSILSLSFFPSGFSWSVSMVDWAAVGIFVIGFLILRLFKCSPIILILGFGAVSLLAYFLLSKAGISFPPSL